MTALLVGVAALVLALVGLTFPGVIAGAGAAMLAGRAWSEANRDVLLVALGCGGAALAIGFIALVEVAYAG
ncbi:hypothetical protein DVA67_004330 [Solirubrobacter sp. CPCC 204708]|uniref:Uncharacterized protein n=1 Tax=Solirubrobacter deserti TaxID=2282478 RepID=A0ABT4RHN9_9ACTN|nr:hypothetical protein [Solirubrobacter deserti]MBE2315188.1 hypothetical protein [Solirubrobacter deserti]MDA0137871.1 hypothetical protein [Solirubrobacter deserti]